MNRRELLCGAAGILCLGVAGVSTPAVAQAKAVIEAPQIKGALPRYERDVAVRSYVIPRRSNASNYVTVGTGLRYVPERG